MAAPTSFFQVSAMVRTLLASLFALSLSACADLPAWPWPVKPTIQPSTFPGARYSFAWRLSGDRAVAPLQVFDDGRRTWLQFLPGQPVPAIFQQDATGDRPVLYTREGPYVVLASVWPRLILRGGPLQSIAERLDAAVGGPLAEDQFSAPVTLAPVHEQAAPPPEPLPSKAAPPAVKRPAPPVLESPASAPESAPDFTPAHASAAVPGSLSAQTTAPAMGAGAGSRRPMPSAQMLTAESFELGMKAPQAFEVSPQDATLRAALARWARAAGWTFDVEHWAVDADIPIVGSARFDTLFKPSVQQLVAATELADRPLQPCFYSNQVLRIVPYAQSCDRTAGPSGAPS
jgi:hypothetical protein